MNLGNENTDAAGGLDLLLSLAREETGLDDDGLGGQTTLAKDLEEATLGDVDDGGDGGVLGGVETRLLGDQAPELLDVHRAKILIKNTSLVVCPVLFSLVRSLLLINRVGL